MIPIVELRKRTIELTVLSEKSLVLQKAQSRLLNKSHVILVCIQRTHQSLMPTKHRFINARGWYADRLAVVMCDELNGRSSVP